MSNKTLLLLTIVVIIGMGIILALNVMPVFFEREPAKYVRQGQIQGAAVLHKGSYYTLNFKQQEKLLSAINQAHLVEKPSSWLKNPNLPIDEIILYTFTGKEIILTPYAIEDKEWIFSAPEWVKKGKYLKETTGGTLNSMLTDSFD